MKLLWLCNMAPSAVQEKLSGKREGGMWIDRVLAGLRFSNYTIRVLFPLDLFQEGSVDSSLSFSTFTEGAPYVYMPELEAHFKKEVEEFRPDVIHIWGTEYGHTLAMINAAEQLDMLDRTVIHIQGLCSVIARHYSEGVPHAVQQSFTFRDLIRQDNISQQQKKFARRGELEIKALQKARHVIGRTDWDKACVKQINPDVKYHPCNETLRGAFYDGQWKYGNCQKHRIFASSCSYPVKGFHYLLEAFAQVLKSCPDATLAVTGQSCIPSTFRDRLRQSGYQKYLEQLIRKYGLEDKVEFLGGLSAEQMKENYLKSNVFVLPSTIENSPNSLGEAMLLGVPCVASDVGGVSDMMTHDLEGYIYPSTAPYMLAHYITEIFEVHGSFAEELGARAQKHAQFTHHASENLRVLKDIYLNLMK